MAFNAKRNQIVGMVVPLVPVDMMHVQFVPPSLALLPAKLASPFVPVLDLLAQTFPVRSVFPFGDAAFPCRIVGPYGSATRHQGFTCAATGNAALFHGLDDGADFHAKLSCDLRKCALLFNVLGAQPFCVVIRLLGTVMALGVLLPTFVAGVPCNGSAATARAQRSLAAGIGSLARAMLTRFGLGTRLVVMLFQHVTDMTGRAIENGGDFLVRRVKAVGLASPVVIADR